MTSRAARALSWMVVALGSAVLLGWAFELPAVTRLVPGCGEMKPNTALGFLLAGLSLRFQAGGLRGSWQPAASRALAYTIALVGLATLLEYVAGTDLGIDQLLFTDPRNAGGFPPPGRMSAATAAAFTAIGVALVLSRTHWGHRVGELFAIVTGLFGALGITGFAYHTTEFHPASRFLFGMALHTAAGFTLLGAGTLLANPQRGLMAIACSDLLGGVLARRLLPSVGLPIGLGWLALWTGQADLIPDQLGDTLFALLMVAVVAGVTLWCARQLNRTDAERTRAEEANAQARRELHRQSSLLRAVLDNVTDGVVVADERGKFILHNPAAERISGFEPLDVDPDEWNTRYGTFLTDGVTPYPADEIPLARAMRGESVDDAEMVIRKEPVGEVWLRLSARPIHDEQGKLLGGVVTYSDVSASKRTEREIRGLNAALERRALELQMANKELESFSYSVSHDLRAPLRAIDGFSQALLEDYADRVDDQGKDYLARVRAAAQRMAQLIDALLDLSRLTRARLRWESLDLGAIAREISDELQRSDSTRAVTFQIEERARAHGDRELLRVALNNLMRNAWKFTAKHATARIEFGVERKDDEVVYFVRDDGAGFEMDHAGKIFSAFQRLHTRAEFEGTGVGLATVARIIQRHGGRIWAQAAVERGATFSFTLGQQTEEVQ